MSIELGESKLVTLKTLDQILEEKLYTYREHDGYGKTTYLEFQIDNRYEAMSYGDVIPLLGTTVEIYQIRSGYLECTQEYGGWGLLPEWIIDDCAFVNDAFNELLNEL